MTRRPEDFDALSNPSTLWSADWYDGKVRLEFEHRQLFMDVQVLGDGNAEPSHGGALTPESVAELRNQLDAWLKWAGHDRRCEHVIARVKPYCGEMACHNYAGKHQSDGTD